MLGYATIYSCLSAPLAVRCHFMIDSGSCENVLAEELVQKLRLKKGNEVKVTKHSLVAFSVGSKYKDQVSNMYFLMCGATKMTLLPSKEIVPKPKAGEGTNLLSRAQFEEEVIETKMFYVLIAKEGTEAEQQGVPERIRPILQEFVDLFPEELPKGLPPLRDIQQHLGQTGPTGLTIE
ncbi:hypothetical protein Acr_22g0009220 [Actinidia rufa]|uniref:Uncharacterized protein n=1 Tax=Actinidia rufa TaxID=165716 RepID=A0A7J0GLG4_9ERIC|nr:hypothetical protein Acr_22g0009220 [Actinidia rufa]